MIAVPLKEVRDGERVHGDRRDCAALAAGCRTAVRLRKWRGGHELRLPSVIT